MTASARGLVAALMVGLAAAGCGGDKKDDGASDAREGASGADFKPADAGGVPDMEKLAADQAKALREMNAGKEIKAVDPAALKALLPAEVAGAKRKNVESSHMNQMGMDIATTKCDFEPEQDPNDDGSNPKPSFRLEITDLGNASGAMGMGLTAWTTMTYEKTTDTGYEKMTKYRGMPCEERYDTESKSGEVKLYVAKRFIVDVHGNDCTMEQIKSVVDALDTSKLEGLVR